MCGWFLSVLAFSVMPKGVSLSPISDAAAIEALFVARKSDAGFDAERVELSVGGFEERFRFSELLDRHDARVERRRWIERVRNGKPEANRVTADVQSFSGERQHVAVMFRGDTK